LLRANILMASRFNGNAEEISQEVVQAAARELK
jgi:hypothetical protein